MIGRSCVAFVKHFAKASKVSVFKDDDESEDEEKENSLPDPQNFGRGRRSAVIDHKLRTGEHFTNKIIYGFVHTFYKYLAPKKKQLVTGIRAHSNNA